MNIQHLNLPKNPFGITTPLRYPGGKSSIAGFLSEVVDGGESKISTYVEPYAGGAGAAISLLVNDKVENIIINDFDPAVYCFWSSITKYPDRFIEKVINTEVTIEEWLNQREIYRSCDMRSKFNLGFAFFFLNRCNRSGIVKGGVIGGLNQDSGYKLDARFNKDALIKKIEVIKGLADRITVSNLDGRSVIQRYRTQPQTLLYIDPPYVEQGKSLYLNAFSKKDHKLLADSVTAHKSSNWIVTYDVADIITSKECYGECNVYKYSLSYSAQRKRTEFEYLICSDSLLGVVTNYSME